jgi:uncharacterized membrane protein
MESMIAFAQAMHTLSAVIWVGGMFFAYVALRPVAASVLQPAERLTLWTQTFSRFFLWVWCAIILLPVTGFWMIFNVFKDFGALGPHVHMITLLGIIMILIFLYVFFIPYLQLRLAVLGKDFPKAAQHLSRIRIAVGVNLLLGVTTVVIASGGRYLF